MPFDAIGFEPLKVVTELPTTPRGRMEYLRDFLKGLPDERFNIRRIFTGPDGESYGGVEDLADCGTAACIVGWTWHIFGWGAFDNDLGLRGNEGQRLCMPDGYATSPERFTRRAAVQALDTYLAEGVIDWERAIAETA